MKQNIKTQTSLLSVGFIIQSLLFFIAMGSGIIGVVMSGNALLIFATSLLLLGLLQMGSGVIMGIILNDKLRTYYFFASIIYLIFAAGLGMITFSLGKMIWSIYLITFGGLIPLGIAYWYLKLTNLTLKKLKSFNGVGTHPDGVEDVLDSGEIFNSIRK